jgi:hypothetical protein
MSVRPAVVGALVVLMAIGAAACGGDDDDDAGATTGPAVTVPSGGRCVVLLHGKGGAGAPTTTSGDESFISPTGNSDGWGAKQWLYFPAAEYDAAVAIVRDAVAGCGPIIVDGFSNGASFAAAMYCHGESFDGRLVRVIIDDPVTDHAVDDCTPAPAVDVTLYATGALESQAPAGTKCDEIYWTCQGGETLGIEAWAAALGVPRQQSPHTDHLPYADPPELSDWA